MRRVLTFGHDHGTRRSTLIRRPFSSGNTQVSRLSGSGPLQKFEALWRVVETDLAVERCGWKPTDRDKTEMITATRQELLSCCRELTAHSSDVSAALSIQNALLSDFLAIGATLLSPKQLTPPPSVSVQLDGQKLLEELMITWFHSLLRIKGREASDLHSLTDEREWMCAAVVLVSAARTFSKESYGTRYRGLLLSLQKAIASCNDRTLRNALVLGLHPILRHLCGETPQQEAVRSVTQVLSRDGQNKRVLRYMESCVAASNAFTTHPTNGERLRWIASDPFEAMPRVEVERIDGALSSIATGGHQR